MATTHSPSQNANPMPEKRTFEGRDIAQICEYDKQQRTWQEMIVLATLRLAIEGMGLRPQTLYGIADSPVGLAAYFLDHDARSYELIARVFAGESAGLTRDDILDNITVTWLTNTAPQSKALAVKQRINSEDQPRGTDHRSCRSNFQFDVMFGELVKYQPFTKL
jgi:hypothetical protein